MEVNISQNFKTVSDLNTLGKQLHLYGYMEVNFYQNFESVSDLNTRQTKTLIWIYGGEFFSKLLICK